jgi:type IV pilus assembly protein PilM
MAVASDTIWAVDLGNCALKAMHLVAVGEAVQVVGFDHIPHGKILSSGVSAAEREELIAITLRQFVERNEVMDEPLIVSVPSQNSFARFVTLPPVEAKKIPEIVQFEAAQQIPFDMSEVEWDHQILSDEDSTEKRVGIFAIKKDVIRSALDPFEREDLQVSYVQMTPMALYNFLLFDRPELVNSDKRATVIINVGADTTDLVVCTASNVWQRCIVVGGNAFTQAIADTFKLNLEKAEKLKRTAPVSKYARQIFQAMRPVFTDVAGEVQKSLGFYTNSNPDVKVTRAIGMGGGTKLRGLLKYLSQTLQIPVEKPDTFKRLAIAPGLSSAKFHESVSDFAVVYGLGLQGLGLARIESNLLPTSVARSMAWASKKRYFTAAAVLFLVVCLMILGRQGWDKVAYGKQDRTRAETKRIVGQAQALVQSKDEVGQKETELQGRVRKEFEMFKYRDTVPTLYNILLSALPSAKNDPDQASLYAAFASGDVKKVMETPRDERKQIFITGISLYYADDLATAQFNKTALTRKSLMADVGEGTEQGGMYGDTSMEELANLYGADYLKQMGMITGEQATKEPGFVVTISGYSPYRQYETLLDPMGVEDKPSKWGFVTRIEHLDRFLGLDPNSTPFKLYSREVEHFSLDKGVVDVEGVMPPGIGEIEFIPDATGAKPGAQVQAGFGNAPAGTKVLVDPMTREPMGAETINDADGRPTYDPTGKLMLKERDHWFTLNFKLTWKQAPTAGQSGAAAPQ